MNSLQINRQNGNVPKSLSGEDHISGFVMYMPETDLPAAFKTDHVQPVSTIDMAESLGITDDAESWLVRVLHYQLSEIFRINDGILLYVGLFVKPESYAFSEIKTVQNYADRRIRQMAVWMGNVALTAEDYVKLQTIATQLDSEAAPLSLLVAPKVADIAQLPTNLAGKKERVSVIIAQAGSGTGMDLFKDAGNTDKASVSSLGVVLGLLSSAAVNESIGWVKKFPTGVSLPAFGDGKLLRDVDRALLNQLDSERYLFFVTYPGLAGSYMNDSHNLDDTTSDYNMIELVRTMDKAVRGIRTYVTPELGGNVYIDESSGKLQPYSVSHLETTANKAIEEMEKAGELSGYKVKIDPGQDVLSNSTVEMVIKNVPVGIMRRIRIKIGFVKTV
ncbi:Protein of unknown function (DUF2586) [Prevotella dentalis DSM 3688]|uniref:DUF2586 family protein n=1 Tax=Prevotella dentalis (strain ATCC 49559 / DSM 3688 / JCM 13448 / NCTC 12043 / ES 2772) TaxID=908937 RepID=F9D786_PREDD|nr:DUF2586 family protein [Prevotella dentalis]AGB29751.1 Protein of unknown function (DUF2586) [Prevotella dentalis DSM 3688]AGB29818.1 Protein of unknown function (DUF2586) [Prevotella dentalis DSM 3688]EGQ11452.1 hypothetical protein HMPREF9136_2714 [Prevotella dentalis DSM 3688]